MEDHKNVRITVCISDILSLSLSLSLSLTQHFLDDVIATDCPFCGLTMKQSIALSLIPLDNIDQYLTLGSNSHTDKIFDEYT